MNPETKIMGHPAPAENENLATMGPYRKIKVKDCIGHIIHLPSGKRTITYSRDDGSFQVWDLEKGMKLGKEWEDKAVGVRAVALSPGGKVTLATGSNGGAVRMWNIDTGKIIKTLKGHTREVRSVCCQEFRWRASGERIQR